MIFSFSTKISQVIWMKRGNILLLSLINTMAVQPYAINLIVSAVKTRLNKVDFITKR
jgi:hypothetical protein